MANDIDRIVGARLRIIRLDQGVSQHALALSLGVSFQQVQKYEKGVNRIGASTLVAMAKAFDIPIAAFFIDFEHANESMSAEVGGVPFETLEAIRLAKAYGSIQDRETRRRILNLVTCLAQEKVRAPID